MGTLKYLFTKSATSQPVTFRRDGLWYALDTDSRNKKITDKTGHSCEMNSTFDDENGIIRGTFTISLKTTDGSTSVYKSHILAERTAKDPGGNPRNDTYALKELVFDNTSLDIHSPGHLDLWMNRMGWYSRNMSSIFVGGPFVPEPFALDEKTFRKDLKFSHDSFLYKLDKVLSARAERKFWFGG